MRDFSMQGCKDKVNTAWGPSLPCRCFGIPFREPEEQLTMGRSIFYMYVIRRAL